MCKILGYGEDALTLWALKHCTSDILESFQDQTAPSDCLIFYRPSFGRHSKEGSAVFGEFDAILVSSQNIYLIESKWDNLLTYDDNELALRPEQVTRHSIFSWYITRWDRKYSSNWKSFVKDHQYEFQKKIRTKNIAPTGSLLATNLEFILNKLLEHCKTFSPVDNIKNVLLFFYNKEKSTPPSKINRPFKLVSIDYSQEITGNFVTLD